MFISQKELDRPVVSGTGAQNVMKAGENDISESLRWAVYSFGIDRVTAEVVTALRGASIESLLVKGPSIAGWLYTGDRLRFYTDTDLLIQKSDWDAAMEVMASLGFQDELGPLAHPRMESGSGYPWGRPSDSASVDLHNTLFGIGADPEDLWDAFSESAVEAPVGGIEVAMPSHAARLLHIALHVVQHGGEGRAKPMMDLSQAIDKAPLPTWKEANLLAERLDAGAPFSAGLQMAPEGKELAAEIGASNGSSTDAALRLASVPMAEGFQELADAKGLQGKSRLVMRELAPNRAFMEWWTPLARRGQPMLAVAYVWRFIWLILHSIPGIIGWQRARRRRPSGD